MKIKLKDSTRSNGEPCCKNGCDQLAAIVIKVYLTDAPAAFLGFCSKHLLEGSRLIENMVQDLITDD